MALKREKAESKKVEQPQPKEAPVKEVASPCEMITQAWVLGASLPALWTGAIFCGWLTMMCKWADFTRVLNSYEKIWKNLEISG